MQSDPRERPKFDYPPPRTADDDVAYIALVALVYLFFQAESITARILCGVSVLYVAWQWHVMKRETTINRIKFRRARTAENYDPNKDERQNSNVLAMLDRYGKKLEMMDAQKWRTSEPITIEERHEGELYREQEKELKRSAKRLKVGRRVSYKIQEMASDSGVVTYVDRKGKLFAVKWDFDGSEQTYYFHDLSWIKLTS